MKLSWKHSGGVCLTIALAIGLLLSGSFSTISLMSLSHALAAKGCGNLPPKTFFHPVSASLLQFFSQMLLLPIYHVSAALWRCCWRRSPPRAEVVEDDRGSAGSEEEGGVSSTTTPTQGRSKSSPQSPLPRSGRRSRKCGSSRHRKHSGGVDLEALRQLDDDHHRESEIFHLRGDATRSHAEARLRTCWGRCVTVVSDNPLLLFILPAACGVFSTVTANVAFLFFAGSALYDIFRHGGLIIIYIAFFAFFLLQRRIVPHHILAIIVIGVGTALVVWSGVSEAEDTRFFQRNQHVGTVGLALLFTAPILSSLQLSLEEFICRHFRKSAPSPSRESDWFMVEGPRDLHRTREWSPLEIRGWEGVWGLALSALVSLVVYFLKGDDSGNRMENGPCVLVEIVRSVWLVLILLVATFFMATYNFCFCFLLIRVGALHACAFDSLRALFVWLYMLAFKEESFECHRFGGLMLLLIGAFLYNRFLRVFGHYDAWYQEYIERHGFYHPGFWSSLHCCVRCLKGVFYVSTREHESAESLPKRQRIAESSRSVCAESTLSSDSDDSLSNNSSDRWTSSSDMGSEKDSQGSQSLSVGSHWHPPSESASSSIQGL